MVKILFLLYLVIFSVNTEAQIQTVSSTRFDEIRLNIPVDSVNKILNSNIRLKAGSNDFRYDTVWVKYKTDSVQLVFSRYLNAKNQVETNLVSMFCKSSTLKTRSGIKSGDNKFDLIKKLDGSTLRIAPDWHFPDNAADKKSYSIVVLYDYTNNSLLNFYFYNNSLYGFECASMEEGG
jgi:hypothetical protein